jgi:hypothetical protein
MVSHPRTRDRTLTRGAWSSVSPALAELMRRWQIRPICQPLQPFRELASTDYHAWRARHRRFLCARPLITPGDKIQGALTFPTFHRPIGFTTVTKEKGGASPRIKPGFTPTRGGGLLRRSFGAILVFCALSYRAGSRAIRPESLVGAAAPSRIRPAP